VARARAVLGIDPGIATTGWALVRQDPAGNQVLSGCGVFLTPAKDAMAARLHRLSEALRGLVAEHRPEESAIEELFIAKNSSSAASVGHGRGAILLTLASLGLPIHEYNPRQVKVSLTGSGAADKSQMQRMVQRLLRLKEIPRPDDAADAVAIALCHLNTFRVREMLDVRRETGKAAVHDSRLTTHVSRSL
jgi:crossover junction endodeoxyribonuclease RuvC